MATATKSRKALPLPWKDVKGLLFDVDGTLTDNDALHYDAFAKAFQKLGYNEGERISFEYYSEHISGRSMPDIAQEYFKSEDQQETFINHKNEIFEKRAESELKPIPGVLSFASLVTKSGKRRVCVTNAPPSSAKLMLNVLGLGDFFEDIILASECEHAKPEPDAYLAGLKRLGLEAADCLAFEDSTTGVKSAKRAGLNVVALTTAKDEDTLSKAGADIIISDFDEMCGIVKADDE